MVEKDRKYILFGLRIVGDFGVSIAVPVVVFAYLGRRLDIKMDTSPWLTIVGFTLAAIISGFVIYRKAKKYGKEYQDLNKKEL